MRGWDPSDHLDAWKDDGPEAWLRWLPPDIRAEVEARPPVTELPWEAGPPAARATFADGQLGDSMLPRAGAGTAAVRRDRGRLRRPDR
jgi:hypothetical protein